MRERERRKKNIIVRGLRERDIKWELEKRLNMRVEITKTSSITGGIITTIGLMGKKKTILRRKGELRDDGIMIENDLTNREKEVQEWLEQEGERERKRGKRVIVGYRKIVLHGECKEWNETEGRLITTRRHQLFRDSARRQY